MRRLARILKVVKERNKLAKHLNEIMKISVSFERLMYFSFMFLILAHITACLW